MQPYDFIIGDCIGMESCFDVSSDFDDLDHNDTDPVMNSSKRRDLRRRTAWRREFPPPISLLARTENLASHMPWVLRRQYSGDGRLVLWEEKVKRQEYFRAQRSNGRLTLQLVVPLGDGCSSDSDEDEQPELDDGDENEEETGMMSVVKETAGMENGKGSGKCLNYDSTCFSRVPVQAIRTILT